MNFGVRVEFHYLPRRIETVQRGQADGPLVVERLHVSGNPFAD